MQGRFAVRLLSREDHGVACRLVFETPEGFLPRPGQFVHVLCGGDGRILRRPYSIFSCAQGTTSILVREAGGGSRWLMERVVGDLLDIMGPLGRGFRVPGGGEGSGGRFLLVAGGAGVAPLHFLGTKLREGGRRVLLLWGMKEGGEYGDLPEILSAEMELRLATEDGSAGERGTVLDLVSSLSTEDYGAVFACGPRNMLKELVESLPAGRRRDLQVSMEERMACGVGACRGCVVPARGYGYLTTCRDGPVFDGEELDWERMRA